MSRSYLGLSICIIFVAVALSALFFTNVVYSQEEDISPPNLLTFDFEPKSIDATTGETVSVTVTATDDLTGVAGGVIEFLSPSGKSVADALIVTDRSDDPEVATLSADLSFPTLSESGTWTAASLTLSDDIGNDASFSASELQALGFPIFLEIQAATDTTPPTLVSFDFNPKTIDISQESKSITVTFGATDDLSQVLSGAVVEFLSPSRQSVAKSINIVSREGSPEVATFQGTLTFSSSLESGQWNVASVVFLDEARNVASFSTNDLRALGFPHELTVISFQDVIPPKLLSFDFNPKIIDTSTSSQDVSISMAAIDDFSGVSSAAVVEFVSLSGQSVATAIPVVSRDGDPEVVTLEGVLNFPQFSELGIWEINGITLSDATGNDVLFTAQDLAVRNLPFSLFNGNTPAGSDVFVSLPGGVEVVFTSVSEGGHTTVAISSNGAPPPNGFRLGTPPTYYDIQTSAIFTGLVEICINYDETQFRGNEENLRLRHLDEGAWVEITTSHDLEKNIICGEVSNLSEFAVMSVPSIEGLSQLVEDFELQSGVERSLLSKLNAAKRALEDDKLKTTFNLLRAFNNEIEALTGGGKITQEQADALIDYSEGLRDFLKNEESQDLFSFVAEFFTSIIDVFRGVFAPLATAFTRF